MSLKNLVISSLLSTILVFQPVMPWVEYYTFKDYIIKNICVNRGNPDSHCMGRCYLQKRLKEVNHENQKDKNPSPSTKTDILLYTLPVLQTGIIIRPELKTHHVYCKPLYFFRPSTAFFILPKQHNSFF